MAFQENKYGIYQGQRMKRFNVDEWTKQQIAEREAYEKALPIERRLSQMGNQIDHLSRALARRMSQV